MGTQAPMLLMFYNAWGDLGHRWNVDGLGWRTDMDENALKEAALLHWNGPSECA